MSRLRAAHRARQAARGQDGALLVDVLLTVSLGALDPRRVPGLGHRGHQPAVERPRLQRRVVRSGSGQRLVPPGRRELDGGRQRPGRDRHPPQPGRAARLHRRRRLRWRGARRHGHSGPPQDRVRAGRFDRGTRNERALATRVPQPVRGHRHHPGRSRVERRIRLGGWSDRSRNAGERGIRGPDGDPGPDGNHGLPQRQRLSSGSVVPHGVVDRRGPRPPGPLRPEGNPPYRQLRGTRDRTHPSVHHRSQPARAQPARDLRRHDVNRPQGRHAHVRMGFRGRDDVQFGPGGDPHLHDHRVEDRHVARHEQRRNE